MNFRESAYASVRARIAAASLAAGRTGDVALVAASKSQTTDAIRALALQGQHAIGENYVREALGKQRDLDDPALQWHMIGPLQSNKCREVALHFDWLQSLDREKLVAPLSRHRPSTATPLNVLVQVNIDDETSKSGCAPDQIDLLADQIEAAPGLVLRGLMAIPAPSPGLDVRRKAFQRMRSLFDALRKCHPIVDTLSMGMSDDFELAIAEGATMVRVGTALFGPRGRD